MKSLKKVLATITSIAMMAATTAFPVSAAGTYTPDSSAVYAAGSFSAGDSVYLNNSSTVTVNDGLYDVYLQSYTYAGMAKNARPSGTYTYIRAYYVSSQAGALASFDYAGYGYSYSYNIGHGVVGKSYRLKSNSSNSSLSAKVEVQWHA